METTFFRVDKQARVDFNTCEMTYIDGASTVVVPLVCKDDKGALKVGVGCMVRQRETVANTKSMIEAAVGAADSSVGIFVPAPCRGHLPGSAIDGATVVEKDAAGQFANGT
ncbi:TPA: hypothetical protein N0F65_005074 [Lagenidium giganteum]|uniref:Uncharacterized protein n=1 Tax=Lagenidium giganteum TaxID=4803 RepID=A0AAV2ZLR0_9STRA|nr:TPA: hypothetical protein N0F65_005074 [Lagenidium giganteum]